MKIGNILFATLILFFTLNLSAQDYNYNGTEVWSDNDLITNASVVFDDDLLIGRRTDALENGAFMFRDSVEYYYDENDRLEIFKQLSWDGQVWVNSFRTLYEYDESGNRTLFHRQDWDNIDWINNYQFNYEYDNNNLIRLNRQEWDNGQWIDDTQDIIAYDSEGLILEQTTDKWNGTEWEKLYKITYEFDDNDNLIVRERRKWDDSEFQADTRYTYGYDDQQNQTFFLFEIDDINGAYRNLLLQEFIYDNNNILTRDFYSQWINDDWVNDNSRDYFYDDRENVSYILVQDWSSISSSWEDLLQTFFYYQLSSKVIDVTDKNLKFNVYPNPSNGIFDIEFSTVSTYKLQVCVYSMQGKKLDQVVLNTSIGKSSINLSHLESGNYMLATKSKAGNSIQKISIQN